MQKGTGRLKAALLLIIFVAVAIVVVRIPSNEESWEESRKLQTGENQPQTRQSQPQTGESLAKATEEPVKSGEWEIVPMVSEEIREAGFTGGEGGQWPHALEVGKADSSLLFYGTNAGGIHRSDDGGMTWKTAMKGYLASGCNSFAIDPVNDRYVLAAGMGDSIEAGQGIYLSVDRGRTWELKEELLIGGNKAYADGLEYDESSYSEADGRCMTAYYSTPYETGKETGLSEEEKGLYRSMDGGGNWTLVNEELADAELFADPKGGGLYGARPDGIFVSTDGGESFESVYEGKVAGFDIDWRNGIMYLSDGKELLRADLEGAEFQKIKSKSFPEAESVAGVAVSPVNGSNLLIQAGEKDERFGIIHQIYASHDGGDSWECWEYDETGDFFPYNSFQKIFAWSYEDENSVWSIGGEHVVYSGDKGLHWENRAQGICGVLCGGKFQFNIFDPSLIFMGFQDLNSALSVDGGHTWEYKDMSGKGFYGHVYGGYAASEKVFWGCLADSWEGKRRITITFDGGETYVDTGHSVSGKIAEVSSYQSYNDPEVFFAGNYRSPDGGKTWEKMDGCFQVYTHNPTGEHELYGCEKEMGYVVVSYDDGETWSRVNQEEIELTKRYCLSEVQVDAGNRLLYVAANGKELYTVSLKDGTVEDITERLPEDALGRRRVNGIAISPESGEVFVAGASGDYSRDYTVVCSEDGGRSWFDATPYGTRFGGDEVISAVCLRIHPGTGDLWCSTDCHGILKLKRS